MNNATMASSTIPKYDTYTFQSEPRAVRQNRPKYRDERSNRPLMGNLMNDPRVIRGNTFKRESLPTAAQVDPVQVQRRQEQKRVAQARARAKAKLKPRDVEPVAGRTHVEVQTELYLEELTDRVEEADMAVQTDPFLDRPPSPLFIPAKTGVDAETQILDGELFDFDLESKPVLEVLVGKTMEQALMEVMEEEELDRLRDHQAEFEEIRNAELLETQRLEEQARRRREERERRMQQQAAVAKQERETTRKIAARSFAQSYLSGLVPTVFDNLDTNGYFYDIQEREIEEQFLPWLLDGIEAQVSKQQRSRALLDGLLRQVVAARSARYAPEPVPTQDNEASEAVVPESESSAPQESVPNATNDTSQGSSDGKDTQDADAVDGGDTASVNEDAEKEGDAKITNEADVTDGDPPQPPSTDENSESNAEASASNTGSDES